MRMTWKPAAGPPGRSVGSRPSALAVLGLLFFATAAAAQERVVVRGQVLDAESLRPLQGVLVTATLSGREALTDSVGRFALTLIEDYGYDILVEDMGYVSTSLRLPPGEAAAPAAILLRPDRRMLAGLDTLHARLAQRRVRANTQITLLEHDELLFSRERSAWDVVRKAVPMAVECRGQRENLCQPGGGRERVVRVCIDDQRPPAGASELLGYEPRDVWLVEVYDRGSRVRVYSRWFVAEAARSRGGEVPQRPPC